MNLITMMDELLRNRSMLYREAREGTTLLPLCGRLLLLFCLTAAIYGAVMGAFRSIHPAYFFSDFEITAQDGTSHRGEVVGLTPERNAIYTRTTLNFDSPAKSVRFNVTNPTDPYTVIGISTEKGYTKIELAKGSRLREGGAWMMPFFVALKIPLLFLLTLLVCSIALYILNLAYGMQLHFMPSLTLMLFALAGTGVMLMVFAPISMLFTVVTSSYHFMKILHVLVFIIAGAFGVKILGEGLRSMNAASDAGQDNAPKGNVRMVLLSWLLLYCLVGSQLAWTLKPFLGTPYLPATPPFRMEKGNIFVSTMESMGGIKPADRSRY